MDWTGGAGIDGTEALKAPQVNLPGFVSFLKHSVGVFDGSARLFEREKCLSEHRNEQECTLPICNWQLEHNLPKGDVTA